MFIFVFENCQNSFSRDPSVAPLWSAKYLNFGGESCEIRILPCSVQETYTSRKVKKTGFTFSIELRSRFDSSHGLLPFVGGYYEDFLYLLVCKVQSSMSMSFATAVTFFSQAKSIAALPIWVSASSSLLIIVSIFSKILW